MFRALVCTLSLLALAGAAFVAAPPALAQSITLTIHTVTATGGGVYDPSTASAGDKFIAEVDVTQMQNGLTVIGYSVQWDPTEVALTAFTDGRAPYDGKNFGPASSNALSVGVGTCATCEIYAGMVGSSGPATAHQSTVGANEAFAETLGVNQINNLGMFSASPIPTAGMGVNLVGAIAQISFEVLTPANGPTDFDIEVFFRAGLDVVGTSAGTDLTASADISGAKVAVQGGAPVPEPATLLLLGSGVAALAGFSRKRRAL